MDKYNEIFNLLLNVLQENTQENKVLSTIPLGISNRHIHLSERDLQALFGTGYELTWIKDLSQPGQFAAKECLILCGPKGAIEKVRVLGPVRKETQVEILRGDCFKLGVNAPVRMSGDLQGTPGITLIGPRGSICTEKGLIVAQRHIHMIPEEASYFKVADGDLVDIKFEDLRGGIYKNVAIRVSNASRLECHLDTEEANAMDLTSKTILTIIN